MNGNIITLILVAASLFAACSATFEFDLLQVVGISGAKGQTPGVNIIDENDGSFSVSLTDSAGLGVTTTSDQYAFITNTFMQSDDTTLSMKLKLDDVTKPNENCIFALQTFDGNQEYMSMGILIESETVTIEGETQTKPVIKQYLFIRRTLGASYIYDYISLKDLLKDGETTTLVVRFQNEYSSGKRRRRATQTKKTFATVSVNCKEVERYQLKVALNDPSRDNLIPLRGMFALGMIYNPSGITKLFKGVMSQPKILNGPSAYEILNACAKIPTQIIASEPLIEDYDPTFFDKYVKMTSESSLPVKLNCVEKNGTVRYSGQIWRPNSCMKYTCSAGEITLDYTCKTCKVGEKVYVSMDAFIDPATPCQKKLCRGGIIKDHPDGKVTCNTLQCDSFGQVKVDGECCEKCKSNSCTKKNTQYSLGCDKKCNNGPYYECPSKSAGCWCQEGYLLNESNECIPSSECSCRVDSKLYQPSQSVKKSMCETCVCSRGLLICMNSC